MPGHLVLKGEKISLYTLVKEDLKLIWKYYGDFELRKYLTKPWKPIYYEKEEEWYEKIIKSDKDVVLEIVENETGKFIGLIGLHQIDFYNRHAEIGYWIWKDFWNKGYATEAVKLMLEYAFKFLNLNKVYARVYTNNKASQRVLEKNGFKLVGKYRKHRYTLDGLQDELHYDILREEWESNKL